MSDLTEFPLFSAMPADLRHEVYVMAISGARPRLLATRYRGHIDGGQATEDGETSEIQPLFNKDIAALLAVPEARDVVLSNIVTYETMTSRICGCCHRGFTVFPQLVQFNLSKDTLYINAFWQKQPYTGKAAVLDKTVRSILAKPNVPVAFDWTALILELNNTTSNGAKLAVFGMILSRPDWTAVIYEQRIFDTRQDRIKSGLFGPDGRDDNILIDIRDTRRVTELIWNCDCSTMEEDFPDMKWFSSFPFDDDYEGLPGVDEIVMIDPEFGLSAYIAGYHDSVVAEAVGFPDPDSIAEDHIEGDAYGSGRRKETGATAGRRHAEDHCAMALHHIQEQWLQANGCFDDRGGGRGPLVPTEPGEDRQYFVGHDDNWPRLEWNPSHPKVVELLAQLPRFTFAVMTKTDVAGPNAQELD
ncbi:unnamed protein product [Discula destructiva]